MSGLASMALALAGLVAMSISVWRFRHERTGIYRDVVALAVNHVLGHGGAEALNRLVLPPTPTPYRFHWWPLGPLVRRLRGLTLFSVVVVLYQGTEVSGVLTLWSVSRSAVEAHNVLAGYFGATPIEERPSDRAHIHAEGRHLVVIRPASRRRQ